MTSDCGETTSAIADNGKSPATHLRQQLHLQGLKGLHASKGWLDSQSHQLDQSHHSQRGAATATAVVQNNDRELDRPPSLSKSSLSLLFSRPQGEPETPPINLPLLAFLPFHFTLLLYYLFCLVIAAISSPSCLSRASSSISLRLMNPVNS
jgi:hypothetical protein